MSTQPGVCPFSGNADMYGLGIRIGFYLQWYGRILATTIAKSQIEGLRVSNSLFVAATFLALLIQASSNSLRLVEIYIVLLLTFGGYLYFVPLYAWKLLTGCSTRWDPSRYPRGRVGKLFNTLNFLLLVSVSVFQLWFWTTAVLGSDSAGCVEYGFLFGSTPLNGRAFVALNIVLYLLLLLFCAGILGITARKKIIGAERKRSRNRLVSPCQISLLTYLRRSSPAGRVML